MEPQEVGPFRRAAVRAKWFAAAFAILCAVGAALSWAGVTGHRQDVSALLLMSLGGFALFIFSWFMIRLAGW
jgi:hypothetical protein